MAHRDEFARLFRAHYRAYDGGLQDGALFAGVVFDRVKSFARHFYDAACYGYARSYALVAYVDHFGAVVFVYVS
jgi:hypothetical protein